MRNDDIRTICWDSCCVIAALNNEPEYGAICQSIMDEARRGEIRLVISTIVIAEVVKGRATQTPVPVSERERIRRLFEHEWLIKRDVGYDVAEAAQILFWRCSELNLPGGKKVNPRDAIHIATAQLTECDFFETADKKLLSIPTHDPNFPVQIRKPTGTGQLRLR